MLAVVVIGEKATAQQYKVQQTTSMAGIKSETTIYVKGMPKRTEGGGYTSTRSIMPTCFKMFWIAYSYIRISIFYDSLISNHFL